MYRSLIPNILTSSNLVFGMCSMISTFNGNLQMGAVFILLALAADDFSDTETRRAARRLTRQWLEHLLPEDGQLVTRELLQSIGLTAE